MGIDTHKFYNKKSSERNITNMSNFTEIKYTEEELQIMEDFEDEMMRIHENPLFYEDDMNMDEIEVLILFHFQLLPSFINLIFIFNLQLDLIVRTSNLSANAREFSPSPYTLEMVQASWCHKIASSMDEF